MGYSTSPENYRRWADLMAYSRKLLGLSKLAAEAAFHVKQGRQREAKSAIRKLERKSKELTIGVAENREPDHDP